MSFSLSRFFRSCFHGCSCLPNCCSCCCNKVQPMPIDPEVPNIEFLDQSQDEVRVVVPRVGENYNTFLPGTVSNNLLEVPFLEQFKYGSILYRARSEDKTIYSNSETKMKYSLYHYDSGKKIIVKNETIPFNHFYDWNFYISSHPDDFKNVWDAIAPILFRYGLLEATIDTVNQKIIIPAYYPNQVPEPAPGVRKEFWEKLLSEIHEALKYTFRASEEQDNLLSTNSPYIFYGYTGNGNFTEKRWEEEKRRSMDDIRENPKPERVVDPFAGMRLNTAILENEDSDEDQSDDDSESAAGVFGTVSRPQPQRPEAVPVLSFGP